MSLQRFSRAPRHAALAAVLMLATLLSLVANRAARGVVIAEGDGSGNTTAPEDDPGFANVGARGPAAAVYLGNRWVITASHVRAGDVELAGQTYAYDASTVHRLENSASGLSPETDILLFQLAEEPPLPALYLGCKPVALGQEVLMIGRGRNRQPETTYWDVSRVAGANNDVWTVVDPPPPPADKTGFLTDSTRDIRWGRNVVTLTEMEVESGFGDVLSFQTSFDDRLAVEFEAQGVSGDSGGAVFSKNGPIWELVGMMHSVDIDDNQPGGANTAIFGNQTFAADLLAYADAIRAIADFEPETGDFDGNGRITSHDIDLLGEDLRLGSEACHFDLDGDGRVLQNDVDVWLRDVANSLRGDADLNGEVDFADFLAVTAHFDKPGGWADGDFTLDRQVGFDDFLVLSVNFGKEFNGGSSTPLEAAFVPEPATQGLILLALLGLPGLRERRRRG